MKQNRGVVFTKPYEVEIRNTPYPTLTRGNRTYHHGVILKVIVSGICGSDLHMFRGRTEIPAGTTFGHEITGEVIECGRDVECIKEGDIVSVPFNVACGRCRNCKEQNTNICLTVNPERPGGAYGYAHMGDWPGGQAEYVMVPYADFNLLKLPAKEQSMPKIKDLALITDVFPTGYHAAYTAHVGIGSAVCIAGAGPVGLACALSCKLLGAACIIVGDVNSQRLTQAKTNGYEIVNLANDNNLPEQIEAILGTPHVDHFIDCVGFEAVGYGSHRNESEPAIVINSALGITRAGGSLAIPGVYVKDDKGGRTANEKKGIYDLHFGACWSKALTFTMGQTPVMRYNRQLMEDILHNKCHIAKELNVTIIPLDSAPEAYHSFDSGAPKKFLIDPHGLTTAWR